jgi:hypothetical protein
MKFSHAGIIQFSSKWLVYFAAAFLFSISSVRAEPNYDESKVGTFTLPDPLVMQNGQIVQTTNDWIYLRRPEILKMYEGYIYGRSPKWRNMLDRKREVNGLALGGKAVRKQVDLEFYNYNRYSFTNNSDTNDLKLHVLLYTPAGVTNAVPVFLCLSFSGNYQVADDPDVFVYPVWNEKTGSLAMPTNVNRGSSHEWKIEEVLARGYGIAIVDYNDIEPDLADGSGSQYGVRSLYLTRDHTTLDPDEWGAISAWAWGASRVMDYLETDKSVDASRVIMLGHSRLGKAALWAGAEDQRFAMVIASCSGEMGAALARRDYGETVTTMCKSFPYWFCQNFLDYSNNISAMPVDSHMLISLIAPRPLYLNTGSEDRWGDPRGEFQAAIAAAPVYQLFGEQGIVTNLPSDILKNGGGSGSILTSAVLETYKMPPLDIPVMQDVGFQTHTGGHAILPEDWGRFLDFADLHFYGKTPHEYKAGQASGTNDVKTAPEKM